MPGGNGTGPMGMGPMTGRAAGFCAGYASPGFANSALGFGRRLFGRGGGRGRRNWFYATGLPGWVRAGVAPAWPVPWAAPAAPSAEDQKRALAQQAEMLEESLGEIRRRLAELEKAGAEK